MRLTERENSILRGAEGEGAALAMEILAGIGEAMEADVFVPVARAHVSLSNQEADLWFAEKMLAGGSRARICATVNPGFDIDYFGGGGFASDRDVKLTERCRAAYKEMGFILNFTCTPYLDGNLPRLGENVAFSESSATAFVNSVVGARSNPESAQSALCSAIVGLTPRYGLLLEENRRASVYVNVEREIADEFDFSLLGWAAAKKIGRDVPLFRGGFRASTEGLINLGAELNTAGRVPLFHVEGVTPEAEFARRGTGTIRELTVTDRELAEAEEKLLGTAAGAKGVILGCPHYSLSQICLVHRRLAGRKAGIPVWILTSAAVAAQISRLPMGKDLKESNVTVIGDTCVDQPCWGFLRGKRLLTDSPKCCYYTARRELNFSVMPLARCLDAALGKDAECNAG